MYGVVDDEMGKRW